QEIQYYLNTELAAADELQPAAVEAMIASRENWIGNIANIRITDASGQIRFGADGQLGQLNYSGLEVFRRLSQEHDAGLLLTPLVRNPLSQEWVQVMAGRYNHADGSFAGMVAVSIAASHFSGLLSGLDLRPS